MVDEQQLLTALAPSAFWESYFTSVIVSGAARVHLAIFVEPYLSYMLDGSKTVESRFTMNASAPYARVDAGDVLLLKRAGGGIEGICRAADAWFYELHPGTWDEIRKRFGGLLRVSADFLATRSRANYATLIRVDKVQRIEPVPVRKRDRRGWVVLRDLLARPGVPDCADSQLALFV